MDLKYFLEHEFLEVDLDVMSGQYEDEEAPMDKREVEKVSMSMLEKVWKFIKNYGFDVPKTQILKWFKKYFMEVKNFTPAEIKKLNKKLDVQFKKIAQYEAKAREKAKQKLGSDYYKKKVNLEDYMSKKQRQAYTSAYKEYKKLQKVIDKGVKEKVNWMRIGIALVAIAVIVTVIIYFIKKRKQANA